MHIRNMLSSLHFLERKFWKKFGKWVRGLFGQEVARWVREGIGIGGIERR